MQGSQCMYCTHYMGMATCPAYPDGIPEHIMAGETLHSEVLKGQEEPLVFEVEPLVEEGWKEYQKLTGAA